jgi:dUTP pyrophosphatase
MEYIMTTLKIFRTHEKIQLPAFATEQSACFDISYQAWGKGSYTGYNKVNAPFERRLGAGDEGVITIMPGDRVMIPTGYILDIPEGYSVRLHPRSGLSLRHGIVLANCEAIIDSDYFNELFLLIQNNSDVSVNIHHGERLAQAELVEQIDYEIEETTVQPSQRTDRVGGLGSTGLNISEQGEPIKRGRGRPRKVA